MRRFGLITSNSIRQVFCRRVIAAAMEGAKPLHLVFAIPDHPWAQGAGNAMVRVSMTVATSGTGEGRLLTVIKEDKAAMPNIEFTNQKEIINSDLTVGVNLTNAQFLKANEKLSSMGVKLHGKGFIVSVGDAKRFGLGSIQGLQNYIKPFINGRDVNQRTRGLLVIDVFGLSETEVRHQYPAVFQHLLLHVKPERDSNPRVSYRDSWWIFGEPRRELRPALKDLKRYIGTAYTAKHRIFSFHEASTIAESMVIVIAVDDAVILGILSSNIHEAWTLASCSWIGFGNDPRYNKSLCFDPFPFPAATPAQAAEIAALAEELDTLRKGRLAAHPHLTLTILYNVLAALRTGQPLSAADRDVLDAGHVEVLRHLHDRLDAAVAAAYGWPADLPAAAIVERVVALNRERAAEEAAGQVRWLRPAFQAPAEAAQAAAAEQLAMPVEADAALPAWPKAAPAQFVALHAALARGGRAGPAELARQFRGARPAKLAPILETLAALGQVREAGEGRYVA